MKNKQWSLSRREILAGSTFAIMSPQVVRGYQANSKISVGLIGSGGRGAFYASILNADPRARVNALWDFFDDRLETSTQKVKNAGPNVYKDFEKLLASPPIYA